MPLRLNPPKMTFVFLLCTSRVQINPTGGAGAEEPPFDVARLVVGTDAQAREPGGAAEVFPAGTQTVCCSPQARDTARVTEVEMVRFFGDKEVDLQDMAGQILGPAQFMVEQRGICVT